MSDDVKGPVDFTAVVNRMRENTQAHRDEWNAWAARQATAVSRCERHDQVCALDVGASVAKSWANRGVMVQVFQACPECVKEDVIRAKSGRLKAAGVEDENVLHATFDNFICSGDNATNLTTAMEFAKKRRGFLVLLGPPGTGKSHLAVAVMRAMEGETMRFITQTRLLTKLRETYRNNRAEDVVEHCKKVKLLVLDEIGLSAGGRDELPMLHDILDARHGSRKPTILTGNATTDQEFNDQIGARMADRLDQSGFRKLWFVGESMRKRFRKDYLKG